MSSPSPNDQQASDQEEHDGVAETSEDDGEAIEVDPLNFCQQEMSSGGQGEYDESIEEHDSDEDINDYNQYIEDTNIQPNDNESDDGEHKDSSATKDAEDDSIDNLKKIPSVQLTVVDKSRDKSEKSEKESCSVPKVTITAIGSSQSIAASKKEDSPGLVNRKRKLENENGFLADSSAEKILTPNKMTRFEPVLDHPIELRKLLFGDLAQEMCITVSRPGTNWQKVLSPLDFDPDSSEVHRFSFGRKSNYTKGSSRVLRLMRQHGDSARSSLSQPRSNHNRNYILNSNTASPEPSPVVKEDSSSTKQTSAITQAQLEEAMASGLLNNFFSSHSILGGGGDAINNIPKPLSGTETSNSKPPAKYNRDLIDPEKGIFEDPETGTIRYRCRNDCGVTLASAKGRRKHERKHCPKSTGEELDAPSGTQQASTMNRYPSTTPSPLATPSINISQVSVPRNPIISKNNSGFKCRFCGQLLTTLEGCKLHEKVQHASEISLSAAVALSSSVNGSRV